MITELVSPSDEKTRPNHPPPMLIGIFNAPLMNYVVVA